MITHFIPLNGYPRSGKDEFVDACALYGNVHKYSTIETVNAITMQMGWDGVKTPESRKMLSELKDFVTKHFNLTFNEMVDLIERSEAQTDCDSHYSIIAMIREPEEIEKMEIYCKEKHIHFCPVIISRTDYEKDHTSHSDSMVEDYIYQYAIDNNSTIDDLKIQAETFMGYIEAHKHTVIS